MEIVLASQSPRRKQLLSRILPEFAQLPVDADETMPEGAAPEDGVRELALRKARKGVERCGPDVLVIGADTIVVCGGRILGKPRNEDDAFCMLKMLSGTVHDVCTGVALCCGGKECAGVERTQVRFAELEDGQIANYIRSGEPMDKAGAYGIQGLGGLLVEGIQGDYHNVVGLPLFLVGRMLKEFGITIL